MRSIALILMTMAGVGAALWVAQAWRMLAACRAQMAETWQQLRDELAARREMVPYLVAAAPGGAASLVDVIGNACDLAANVSDVSAASQAEARLSAALNRLAILLDEDEGFPANVNLRHLRVRLAESDGRIDLLRESFNRQVDTFNALLERGGGWLLASASVFRRAERF